MEASVFINLLFGHLVGDFLLQNKWMALSKGNNSWRCLVHCIVYTASVCALTGFQFATHLADWCKMESNPTGGLPCVPSL